MAELVPRRGTAADAFRAHLVQVRRARGVSVRALSALLKDQDINLLPSAITKIEAGARRIELAEAVGISRALRVDLTAMVSSDPIPLSIEA
jgi:hypothetical protein